jgi:cytochrome c-type biogenesis protein CcmH
VIRLAALLFCAWTAAAYAVQPDEQLADPVLEQRARAISAGLRCLVCQNQSIDDSDAPLARDLRLLVRQRLQDGDADADVRNYLVARYGDFILLKPPFEPATLFLWLTPLLVLGAGTVVLALRAKRAPAAAGGALSAEEEGELTRILRRD